MTSGDSPHATQTAAASTFPVVRASSARVWNMALGGKDHFQVDRDVVATIREVTPDFPALAKASQQFVFRAAAYLAGRLGITQYLDCGPGLPTGGHIHDFVQAFDPRAKVLYVDNDPIVLSHAQALRTPNAHTRVLDGDIFAPGELLQHEEVVSFFDWSRPIVIFHTATLHHHPGDIADLAAAMQTYIDEAPAGSCTVISHLLDPEDQDCDTVIRQVEKLLVDGTGGGWFRPISEIRDLFPDQDVLGPRIVPCHQWPNKQPTDLEDEAGWLRDCIVGGIGRKRPGRR